MNNYLKTYLLKSIALILLIIISVLSKQNNQSFAWIKLVIVLKAILKFIV